MTENQKQFSAFIESVCQKCGCTEATEALQKGFAAFCESYDPYEDAARRRVLGQLRNNIKVTTSAGKTRLNRVDGQKSYDQVVREIDAEHPELRGTKDYKEGLASADKRNQLIAERMAEQFGKNNNAMARRNADAILALPFHQLKEMFPNAYLKIVGDVWVRKYLKTKKDKVTGNKEVIGASGDWMQVTVPGQYTDEQTALTAAKRRFSPGHWKLVKVIPELMESVKQERNACLEAMSYRRSGEILANSPVCPECNGEGISTPGRACSNCHGLGRILSPKLGKLYNKLVEQEFYDDLENEEAEQLENGGTDYSNEDLHMWA